MLDPELTKKYVESLDKTAVISRTLDGLQHTAGIIGINNVKNNDHVSVTLQALGHVSLLRNFFLLSENNQMYAKSEFAKRFALFLRKMWSPKLYRNHVSPHEILQVILKKKQRRINKVKDQKRVQERKTNR